MNRYRLARALALLLCLPLVSHAVGVELTNIRIAAAPPGSSVHAAYLDAENTGDTELALVAVTGAGFTRVEIHKTVIQGDVVSMVRLERLTLPAHGRVSLRPGATHLMLFSAPKTLTEGDKAQLEFHFSDGSRQIKEAPIKRYQPGSAVSRDASGRDHSSGHNH